MRTEQSTASLLDVFPDAIFVVDHAGLLVECNGRAWRLLQTGAIPELDVDLTRYIRFGDLNSLSLSEILDLPPETTIPCTILDSPHRRFESRTVRHVQGQESRWMLIVRDVTNRESEEQRYRESLKMEAVRTLAGHVGNDFNNVLAAVNGRLEAVMTELTDNAQHVRSELAFARADLKRGARLVRQLQRLSQTPPRKHQRLDPEDLIADCITAVQHECPANLSFETIFEHGQATIEVDIQQIGDVLVSILQNARDAMPHGGKIIMRTSVTTAGPKTPLPNDKDVRPFLRVQIEDSGRGISPDSLPKIFEPFFTTKLHRGAGLGLAGVYEALRNHHGGISVESTVGSGSTFNVYLPTAGTPDPSAAIKTDGEHRGGTILVIDDEKSVRNIVRNALQREGYTVLEASDGDEGLEVIREHRERIHLVILDIVMPRMSGWDVLKALKDDPKAPPVIVQSGYVGSEPPDRETSADAFLGKPYDLVDLLRVVREVLGQS